MVSVNRHFLRLSLLLAACAAASCGAPPTDTDHTKVDTRFEENKGLFAAIRDAGQLTLYEGPPREFVDSQHAEEHSQKRTVTLHGFPFYATPLEIGPEEAVKLKGLLADERSFFQWRGPRKCGGFHPDYLAEYRVGESVYRFLICFTCHEAMVFGPGRSLRCDISDEHKELEMVFKKYRKYRTGGPQP